MLTSYQNQTTRLLQNPAAPQSLYATTDITTWINSARQQLAAEGECVRAIGTIQTTVNNRVYNFSGINGFVTGINNVLHVRRISYNVASGMKWLIPRPWTYFDYYFLNNPVPVSGFPQRWAQLGQGALGSFYIDPPPDLIYTLNCDVVCLPINLVDDTTVEVIPFPWTDAVPYYAAYLALLSAQSPARIADAERMFQKYEEYVSRARNYSNPDVLKSQYLQQPDPTLMAKLGLQQKGGQ